MSDDLEGADIWGDSSGDSNENNNNEANNSAAADTNTVASNEAVVPPAAASAPAPAPEPTTQEDDETMTMSNTDLRQRIRLLDNDIRVMKSDVQRISHESRGQKERIRENKEKVKVNKQLPYLVGNVVEVLEPEAEDGLEEEAEEEGAAHTRSRRYGRTQTIRSHWNQQRFLPHSRKTTRRIRFTRQGQ
eukprot:155542_1